MVRVTFACDDPSAARQSGTLYGLFMKAIGVLDEKARSPGDTRPQNWLSSSSGVTREYGMVMFEPRFGRFPLAIFGAFTFPPGSTLRPRKAGSPPGTPVGLPVRPRLTPVSGLPGCTAARPGLLMAIAAHALLAAAPAHPCRRARPRYVPARALARLRAVFGAVGRARARQC